MKTGDSVAFTDNKHLMAALVVAGIPLHKDRYYFYRLLRGKEKVRWFLEVKSADGSMLTKNLMKAWYQADKGDDTWFKRNPRHPFTKAREMYENIIQADKWIEDDVPYVTFNLGDGQQLHPKLGSSDYEEAIGKGLKPL